MVKDITGANINVGDIVVAPFGKDFCKICEVIKIRPKTCLVVPVDATGIHCGNKISKHTDAIVVINSVTNKLDLLGF